MIEVELVVPSLASPTSPLSAESIIESCCVEAGLRVSLRGTLKQYPGCVHWHLKRGADKGTLEITLWREQQRIWFKVSANRTADWVGPTMNNLKACIESALH